MMEVLALGLTLLVALEHLYIMGLEMFASGSRTAQRTFNLPAEFLADRRVKTLFANQGLYNGFLAAGLIWGALIAPEAYAFQLQVFFLGCVIVAAAYGAVTSNKGILIKQGLPAIVALIVVLLAG